MCQWHGAADRFLECRGHRSRSVAHSNEMQWALGQCMANDSAKEVRPWPEIWFLAEPSCKGNAASMKIVQAGSRLEMLCASGRHRKEQEEGRGRWSYGKGLLRDAQRRNAKVFGPPRSSGDDVNMDEPPGGRGRRHQEQGVTVIPKSKGGKRRR